MREVVPEATVKNVDVLELTNAAFRRLYGKAYLDLVNRAPHVLGYFYDLLDQPSRSGRNRGDRLRLAVEKLNLRSFIRFLKDEPWDLVINTHFLPAEIIASLRKKEELQLAAGDGDDRFRDASPVGQSAVRPLLHRHGRGGAVSCSIGACRRSKRR